MWLNLLWFTIHFFSIPQLAASWFSPFKRITEDRRGEFNFEAIAGYVIINLLSRVVGALMRTIIIGVGMLILSGMVLAGFVLQIVWIFLPLLLIGGLVSSISILLI